MKIHTLLLLSLLAIASPLLADKKSVDCGKGQDLNKALQNLSSGDALTFTGTCNQNVVISTSGITLTGQNGAIIASPSHTSDALTISGAQRVTLQNFSVQTGNNGLHATGSAGVTLQNIVAQRNAQTGILIEGTSIAYVADSASQNNGFDGVDVENTSSIVFNGDFAAQNNGVFGINLGTTSSATVNAGTVSANRNTLGIQVSINSSWFLSNPGATVSTQNNLTVGLTVVSGAHLFSFGGSLTSSANGLDGFDIASRAGVDFDGGSQVKSFGNQRDGFHVEDMSMVNLFNNPQFSGNPGFTTLQLYNNAANGLSLLSSSRLNMFDQAKVLSHNNTGAGIQVDDGSNMNLLGSTIQNNPADVRLTFGSRGDFSGNTIGTLTCDATALIRGDTGKTCPAN